MGTGVAASLGSGDVVPDNNVIDGRSIVAGSQMQPWELLSVIYGWDIMRARSALKGFDHGASGPDVHSVWDCFLAIRHNSGLDGSRGSAAYKIVDPKAFVAWAEMLRRERAEELLCRPA